MGELLAVYRTHRQGLFSLALSITHSRQLAEDAVQDAFTRMTKRSYPAEDLVAYVFRAVRNASIDLARVQQRDQRLHESLFNGRVAPDVPADPQLQVLNKERDQILRAAIDHLPEHEREAVVLKALAGLTYQQAEAITDVPAKTLASRYRRALIKLESKLRGQL